MHCTLKIIAGPDNGQEFVCPPGETFIGRSQRCGVKLATPSVSYEHAVITRTGDEYYIENLSANGTFVNGERIAARTRLRLKDQVRFGPEVAARVTTLPMAGGGSTTRRLLLITVIVMAIAGVALLVADPFGGGPAYSWADWTRTYGVILQFSQQEAAARRLPRDVPALLAQAWRLESAGDRTGAAPVWTNLHVLLHGRGDDFGLEAAASNNPAALRHLLAARDGAPPPDDDDQRAALYEFVTRMERRN